MNFLGSLIKIAVFSGTYPDDEDLARARALHIIVWTLFAVGALTVALAPLVPGSGPYFRFLVAVCALYLVGSGLLFLNARGKTRLASFLFVVSSSALVTWLALTAGGVSASAVNWYVIIVAATGLLLGETAGFLAAGLVSALSLALVILELTGHLPSDLVIHSPIFLWFGVILSVVGIACVQYLAARMVREALSRVRKELQERGKREALFRAVVDNSYDAVVLLDVERHLKYVSPSFLRIGGYAPSEIEETYGPMYTHPDDRALTESMFRDALESPGTSHSLEYRVRHKQGHWIWLEVRATNLLNDPHVQALVLNVRDITDRKRSDDALQDSMEQLHALSAELEHAREQERKTTAREVHDELGQILTAIRMGVEKAGRRDATESATPDGGMGSLLHLVDQGIHAVQRIAARLRPGVLDDLGLLPAMEWRVEEFQKQSDIICSLSLPDTEPAIDEERSTALFRILGELLTNVARHAKATRIAVTLFENPQEFTMSVVDDGVGMAVGVPEGPHAFGFKGIKERLYPFGGHIAVQSGSEGGTEVVIHLPRVDRTSRQSHG